MAAPTKKCQRLNKLIYDLCIRHHLGLVTKTTWDGHKLWISLKQNSKRVIHGPLRQESYLGKVLHAIITQMPNRWRLHSEFRKSHMKFTCQEYSALYLYPQVSPQIQIPLIFQKSVCSRSSCCCLPCRSCFHTLWNCMGLLSETDGELLEETQFKHFTTQARRASWSVLPSWRSAHTLVHPHEGRRQRWIFWAISRR